MYTNMTTNLMVENVDETIAFYKDVLGFSLIESVPGKNGGSQFAIMQKDSAFLMFQERENFIEECPSLQRDKTWPSVSLYTMVDNFDELYAELKSKLPMLIDLHTTFYGAREFAIADNTGYVLSFTEHKEV